MLAFCSLRRVDKNRRQLSVHLEYRAEASVSFAHAAV
jgi:hypothetical protein